MRHRFRSTPLGARTFALAAPGAELHLGLPCFHLDRAHIITTTATISNRYMVVAWTAVLDGVGDGLRPFPVDKRQTVCPQESPRRLRRSGMGFCLGNSEGKKPEMLLMGL